MGSLVRVLSLAIAIAAVGSGVLYGLGVIDPSSGQRSVETALEEVLPANLANTFSGEAKRADESGRGKSDQQVGRDDQGRWTPRRWRTHVQQQFRLSPDARFLRALKQLLDTGGNPRFGLKRSDQYWRLSLDDHEFEFPARAGFDDLYPVLHQAVPDSADLPADAHPAEMSMRFAELLAQLGERDAGEVPDPRKAVDEARAAARLLLLRDNEPGISDVLAVRALIALVTAEAAGANLPLERSMVAWSLGYQAHGRSVARRNLDHGHVWRRYLERRMDDPHQYSSALGTYLALRDAALRRESIQVWTAVAEDAASRGVGPLAIARSAYGLDDFGPGYRALLVTPHLAVQAAGGELQPSLRVVLTRPGSLPGFDTQEPVESLQQWHEALAGLYPQLQWSWQRPPVQAFEQALRARASDETGDPRIDRAVLGSAFYGAVDRRADFHLDKQSSYGQTRTLIDHLSDQPGPHADAIATKYELLLMARRGQTRDAERFLQALEQIPLGPNASWPLFNEALENLSWKEGVRESAFRRYAGLDTSLRARAASALAGATMKYPRAFDQRPMDRHRLLEHADATLSRPLLTQRLANEVVDLRGRAEVPQLVLQQARAEKDRTRLRRMADDDELPAHWRARAWRALAELGQTSLAERGFQQLVTQEPGDWELYEVWIEGLRERGEHERIRGLARSWYQQYGGHRGSTFDHLEAVIAEARAALAEGRLTIARDRADRIMGMTGAAREYRLMIDVLQAQGRHARARQVAGQLVRAYPDTIHNRAPLVRIQWCNGEPEAAARTLSEHGPGISYIDWRDELGEPFRECLADDPAGLTAAVRALQQQGFRPRELGGLMVALGDQGEYRAAYKVAAAFSPDNRMHQVYYSVRAAAWLSLIRDPEEVEQWLRSRIPEAARGPASEPIYWYGAHDLLWTLVPEPEQATHRDGVWLLRSDSVAVDRTTDRQRQERAHAYMRNEPETFYAEMGRVVLGLDPVKSLARRPLSDEHLVEATYQLGVRAVADERPRDAVEWFVASMAAGERFRGEVEYRWANEIVTRIAGDRAIEDTFARHGADYLMPWGLRRSSQ